MSQRMFVAVRPPEHVLEDLEAFLAPRREAAPFRWALPEQWHVTLAFAAAVPDRVHEDLAERLGSAARRRTAFGARVAGGGAFPDVARARVLYAGLGLDPAAATELDRLAVGARTALATAGADPDGRRFRPHLTLARRHRPADVVGWVRLLDAYRGPAWTVDRVDLVASSLGQGPHRHPRHDVVDSFLLGPGRGIVPDDRPVESACRPAVRQGLSGSRGLGSVP